MQIDMKLKQVKPTFSMLYLWNSEHGIDYHFHKLKPHLFLFFIKGMLPLEVLGKPSY